ncbi:RCC1 domain-containing protein [Croceimicrobium hydrocarbonivorans]|uniref:T9SS type A sorting domain-containing protein n=1 Tax=Croceimicrobium hydrocarbonivorans TaxID=2761580 RepID=A0A7H0VBM7_9FLAO|nr:T9SS type A sorting domain-containing protein [Croceimicrobium hydrocarbonivorans]QNR23125.1 T9SS type A sorting domain-containing protein [Croceimicrobium hydrocarbonivorans]
MNKIVISLLVSFLNLNGLFAQVIEARYGVVLLKCADNQLYFAGINESGQSGNGSTGSHTSSFSKVPGMDSIHSFASGIGYVLAVKSNGDLYAWGDNLVGNLGIGPYWDTLIPALVPNVPPVKSIAAGDGNSILLSVDSLVFTAGSSAYGALGRSLDSIPRNYFGPVDTLQEIVSVYAGYNHSAALDKYGQLWLWGAGGWGQLGLGNLSNRFRAGRMPNLKFSSVFLADFTSFGIDSSGHVWAWGENQQGELGVPIATNGDPYIVNPQQVQGINQAVQIASGFGTTLALLSDGRVKAWGRNNYFQLGDGTLQDRFYPDYVPGLQNIYAVGLNGAVCYALDSLGTLYTWGYGYEWLLQGNDTLKALPTPVNFTACIPSIGAEEQESNKIMELYPNPVTNYLQVRVSEGTEAELSIYNLKGELVWREAKWRARAIDLSGLANGLYLLKLVQGDEVYSRKILIKR